MQFLKTLFWVALAVVLVLFSKANWHVVTIELWGGLEVDTWLPILVFAAFVLGFLPTFLLYQARLWSLRRRLETHERNSSGIQGAAQSTEDHVDEPAILRRGNPETVTQVP